MDLQGKRVTVVGLGQSGVSALRLLIAHGAIVTANDARSDEELGERAAEARALGATLLTGRHDVAQLQGQDLIVVSPGVPPLAELAEAGEAGVEVIGEVELAMRFIEADVAAVTGTNGKSTVTMLLGEMAKASGRPSFVGGNLGTPLVETIGTPAAGKGGLVVVELSSFQLERVSQFRAHVALLLNVTDDHLDRYPGFEAYAAAKARIFERQTERDFACLPAGDVLCHDLARDSEAQKCTFGSGGDVYVEDDRVVDKRSGWSFPTSELRLSGAHNFSNVCAAVLAAGALGLPASAIEAALRGFGGLPHRVQHVADVRGIPFYDDSKATNVGAAVAAVRGLAKDEGRVVLIAGGVDKGGSYRPLVDALREAGRGAVLIGEAAPLLTSALSEAPELAVREAGSMDEAIDAALALAQPGDLVLLSPACSSFDMFRSYAHRGDVFQRGVRARTGTPQGEP